MRMIFFLLLIGAFIAPAGLWANDLPNNGCDTIFTTDGKVHLVRIVAANKQEVLFERCDTTSSIRYQLSIDKVERYSYNSGNLDNSAKSYKKDPIGKRARGALILACLGTLLLYGLSIFGLPGVILLVIGVINGERVLRSLKKTGRSEDAIARKAKKEAKVAIILSYVMFALFVLALILLI